MAGWPSRPRQTPRPHDPYKAAQTPKAPECSTWNIPTIGTKNLKHRNLNFVPSGWIVTSSTMANCSTWNNCVFRGLGVAWSFRRADNPRPRPKGICTKTTPHHRMFHVEHSDSSRRGPTFNPPQPSRDCGPRSQTIGSHKLFHVEHSQRHREDSLPLVIFLSRATGFSGRMPGPYI